MTEADLRWIVESLKEILANAHINEDVRRHAVEIIMCIDRTGMAKTKAARSNGGLKLHWDNGDKEMQVRIDPDEIDLTCTSNATQYKRKLQPGEAEPIIQKIEWLMG